MKCCGREVTSFELEVQGQPYLLYRCPDCETSHWMREDERVDVGELTQALHGETRERAARRAARRGDQEA